MTRLAAFWPSWRILVLICTLPMFGQTFQIANDIKIFYLISKAWPFLMLPLSIYALIQLRIPGRLLWSAFLLYAVVVPPIMTMVDFDNTYLEALTSTVKIVPVSNYLSLSVMLLWLKPTRDELARVINGLGYATFILMFVLWEVMPKSAYSSAFGSTSIFVGGDDIRGDRIMMPTFFGIILILQLGRRFSHERKWHLLLQIVIAYALMVTIYKERTTIFFSFAVLCIAFAEAAFRSRKIAIVMAVSAGVAMVALLLGVIGPDVIGEKFGGSGLVRVMTIEIAWNYLRAEPLRWIIGAGGTTAYAQETVNIYFNNNAFFLADIGWLGMIFEYGLIGSALICAIHVTAINITRARAVGGDVLVGAMADYALYLLFASSVYSVGLLPGEVGFVTAVAVYLGHLPAATARDGISRLRTSVRSLPDRG